MDRHRAPAVPGDDVRRAVAAQVLDDEREQNVGQRDALSPERTCIDESALAAR